MKPLAHSPIGNYHSAQLRNFRPDVQLLLKTTASIGLLAEHIRLCVRRAKRKERRERECEPPLADAMKKRKGARLRMTSKRAAADERQLIM